MNSFERCTRFLGIASVALVLNAPTAAETQEAGDPALGQAREFLKQNPLIDGHNDLPAVIRESGVPPRDVEAYDLKRRTAGDTDIGRLREGGVGGQFWSVWIPSSAEVGKKGFARIQLEQIDIALRMIERYPDDLRLALSAAEIDEAIRAGRIASLLGIEGGHAIENSLGVLRAYYRLGVRYMTLTHFNGNDWADSATEAPRHGGLTNFGAEVVKEMNRLGMLVDISHVSSETMSDVLDIAEAPVIFSHSSALAVTPSIRNVPDEVLRRLPANGGVVMVNFISEFNVTGVAFDVWQSGFAAASGGVKIGDARYDAEKAKYSAIHPEPKATIRDIASHIEHIRDVAGIDHVGIGADFFGDPSFMAAELEDTSRYPHLFAELIRRGWNDEMLIKLAQGQRASRPAWCGTGGGTAPESPPAIDPDDRTAGRGALGAGQVLTSAAMSLRLSCTNRNNLRPAPAGFPSRRSTSAAPASRSSVARSDAGNSPENSAIAASPSASSRSRQRSARLNCAASLRAFWVSESSAMRIGSQSMPRMSFPTNWRWRRSAARLVMRRARAIESASLSGSSRPATRLSGAAISRSARSCTALAWRFSSVLVGGGTPPGSSRRRITRC